MLNQIKNIVAPEPPLTTGDVAKYCHITQMQVNRWIKNGVLHSYKTPGGQNRVTRDEFRKFLEKHGMPINEDFFPGEARRKVLVADDDRHLVDAICAILLAQSGEFKVEKANDGYETLLKAGDFKPDLLVLDIRMPKIDGLEVCRRLIDDNQVTGDMKILAITGHAVAYDRDVVLSAGADEYLLKPFEMKEFLKRVKELLK